MATRNGTTKTKGERSRTNGQSSEDEEEDDDDDLDDDSDTSTGDGNDQDADDGGSGDDDHSDEDDDDQDDNPKLPKTQAALDDLIQQRLDRQERSLRARIKKDVEDEIKAQQAREKNDFKGLYEAEVAKREAIESERDELKRRLNDQKVEKMRRDVARKVGIPSDAVHRIQGKTEKEMTRDAKELRKILRVESEESDDQSDAGATNTTRPGRNRTASGEKRDYDDPGFWLPKT